MATQPRGAGGTPGGSMSFIIGLIMACAGFYMLLDNIVVSQGFGFGSALYRLLIPFMFGVGWIFYNARAPWGWILAGGALAAIVFGVIMSLSINIRAMSLLDLIIILVLMVGGLGIFARSLRKS
jgi:uncharacterized protein